jgi:hypothetical protein
MKQNKDTEIYLGGGNNIEMKSSRMVTAYQVLYLTTPTDGTITLNVKIEADFDTVPEKYHEVFMNMMSVKYLNRVSFGDNPFSQCLPAPKHKWYQFWKKLEYKTKTV